MTAVKASEHAIDSLDETDDFSDVKARKIKQAWQSNDVSELIKLAVSEGGLVNDELRRFVWPVLLGYSVPEEASHSPNLDTLRQHRDEEQVQKDVDRAFVYYPTGETQLAIRSKKRELSHLILHVLRANQGLHYFQGYHDIAQVFLLVLGEKAAVPVLTRVSLLRIRDYMLSSLEPAMKHLELIPAILYASDPRLARHLAGTKPFFALSAVLTLYAHDMTDYAEIARLFDFVLAHEPVMSLYLFVATIISRQAELLDIPDDEPDMLLFKLTKMPENFDLQGMIEESLQLYSLYPPENLPGRAWSNISRYSCLKTSRDVLQPQSIVDAERCFNMQSRQIQIAEIRKKTIQQIRKNRRPILIGASIVVGIVSYYLRRTGTDGVLWWTLWRVVGSLRRGS